MWVKETVLANKKPKNFDWEWLQDMPKGHVATIEFEDEDEMRRFPPALHAYVRARLKGVKVKARKTGELERKVWKV